MKHSQYSKNTINFPPPKLQKGGENRKKIKKMRIGRVNAHEFGDENRYEMQDRKNYFFVYRNCDDARNVLYSFCLQKK